MAGRIASSGMTFAVPAFFAANAATFWRTRSLFVVGDDRST
jgi:hypothetical protein